MIQYFLNKNICLFVYKDKVFLLLVNTFLYRRGGVVISCRG